MRGQPIGDRFSPCVCRRTASQACDSARRPQRLLRMSSPSADELRSAVAAAADAAGFVGCGVADAAAPDTLSLFHDWLDAGMAGEMSYLERRREAYADPSQVLPSVRSVVMLAMPYRTADPAEPQPHEGRISRYAWSGRDYHDVVREAARGVAAAIHDHAPGSRTRVVVDTAPLLERDFARRAGLGWFGKNTMLLSKHPDRRGSYVFLAGLLTSAAIAPDAPMESAHCGTCTACLDVCPTDAFPQPYVLDARRCISYLTIELRDRPVPQELRDGLGEWVFGCDLCQDVCPWNRRAPHGPAAFAPRDDLNPVDLLSLLRLDEAAFAARFAGTPLERTGRDAIVRNACYAAGNARLAAAGEDLRRLQDDESAIVRDAATWALERTASGDAG